MVGSRLGGRVGLATDRWTVLHVCIGGSGGDVICAKPGVHSSLKNTAFTHGKAVRVSFGEWFAVVVSTGFVEVLFMRGLGCTCGC